MNHSLRRERPCVSEAIFRMLLSLIFLVAAGNHLLSSEKIVQRLEAAPFANLATALAPAELLVHLAGVALFVGGLGLITGTLTRVAAIGLICVLIPITITVQLSPASLGPLFKNVAILGGLIYFAVNGAACVSVDAWLAHRTRSPQIDQQPTA